MHLSVLKPSVLQLDVEVQRMKKAVESLMVANEEKVLLTKVTESHRFLFGRPHFVLNHFALGRIVRLMN